MARKVLIAAPPRIVRKLADAIASQFDVVTCTEPEKAIALAAVGTYLAIVKTKDFAQLVTDNPVVRVGEPAEQNLVDELVAIRDAAGRDQRARAQGLAYLATLSYEEYVVLVRARSTRDYLLARLGRHSGVVAEAAREAGLLRETLHRLIRRHDINPDWFRDED
jgi:DNA-binding NtrC family response regulator